MNLAKYKIGVVIKPPNPIHFNYLLFAKSNKKLNKTSYRNFILLEVSKTFISIFLFRILLVNFLPAILVIKSILVCSLNFDSSFIHFIAGKTCPPEDPAIKI